jgi:hypothetical protein
MFPIDSTHPDSCHLRLSHFGTVNNENIRSDSTSPPILTHVSESNDNQLSSFDELVQLYSSPSASPSAHQSLFFTSGSSVHQSPLPFVSLRGLGKLVTLTSLAQPQVVLQWCEDVDRHMDYLFHRQNQRTFSLPSNSYMSTLDSARARSTDAANIIVGDELTAPTLSDITNNNNNITHSDCRPAEDSNMVTDHGTSPSFTASRSAIRHSPGIELTKGPDNANRRVFRLGSELSPIQPVNVRERAKQPTSSLNHDGSLSSKPGSQIRSRGNPVSSQGRKKSTPHEVPKSSSSSAAPFKVDSFFATRWIQLVFTDLIDRASNDSNFHAIFLQVLSSQDLDNPIASVGTSLTNNNPNSLTLSSVALANFVHPTTTPLCDPVAQKLTQTAQSFKEEVHKLVCAIATSSSTSSINSSFHTLAPTLTPATTHIFTPALASSSPSTPSSSSDQPVSSSSLVTTLSLNTLADASSIIADAMLTVPQTLYSTRMTLEAVRMHAKLFHTLMFCLLRPLALNQERRAQLLAERTFASFEFPLESREGSIACREDICKL